jgi:hypothetical protein
MMIRPFWIRLAGAGALAPATAFELGTFWLAAAPHIWRRVRFSSTDSTDSQSGRNESGASLLGFYRQFTSSSQMTAFEVRQMET